MSVSERRRPAFIRKLVAKQKARVKDPKRLSAIALSNELPESGGSSHRNLSRDHFDGGSVTVTVIQTTSGRHNRTALPRTKTKRESIVSASQHPSDKGFDMERTKHEYIR